jgi:hypothetical protein
MKAQGALRERHLANQCRTFRKDQPVIRREHRLSDHRRDQRPTERGS